jgi:hypothetical protein
MPAEEGSSADEYADLCRENSTDQDDSSQLQHLASPEYNFVTPAPRKRRKNSTSSISIDDANRSAFDFFQAKKKENKQEDPDLSFLKSILPDMKEMTGDQKRRFKVGILNLAGQILSESTVSPAQCFSSSSSHYSTEPPQEEPSTEYSIFAI